MPRFRSLLGSLLGISCCTAVPVEAGDPWSGLYAGVHAGHVWSGFTNYDKGPILPHWWGVADYGSDTDGLFAGGQIGYNLVAGSFLFGVEGELGAGSLSGSAVDNQPGSQPLTQVRSDYYGAITGRAGVVLGSSFLVYGKAGWGVMGTRIKWSDPVFSSTANASPTLDGAVYGGGLEFAAAPGITIKAEYLHFDIGGKTTMPVVGWCCNFEQTVGIENINAVKVGVNVKLGG